jgi:hypothetical protein
LRQLLNGNCRFTITISIGNSNTIIHTWSKLFGYKAWLDWLAKDLYTLRPQAHTHLVSGALDTREGGDGVDPLVELSHQPTATHLHWRPQVHDLVGDVEFMADDLG